MAIDASNIWQLTDALNSQPDDKTNTRLATVSRIDNEGHVWVSIPGGETETPTETTDVEVERGDTVTVEWRNNKLYVLGNSTQPATSVRRVTQIVEPIEETANEAAAGVGKAVDASKAAQQAAAEAQGVAEAVNQHFWYDDNGAHVTTVLKMANGKTWSELDDGTWGVLAPQTWQDATNAVIVHAADEGYNSIWNSLGWLLRYADKFLVSITHSALAFYDGQGNAQKNVLAQFGSRLTRIGKYDQQCIEIDADAGTMTFLFREREYDTPVTIMPGGIAIDSKDGRTSITSGQIVLRDAQPGVVMDRYSIWARSGSWYDNPALLATGNGGAYELCGEWDSDLVLLDVAPYDTARTPRVRVSAGMCNFVGVVKPDSAEAVPAGTTLNVCTLPESYRPAIQVNQLCQGSNNCVFLLQIATTGNVTISRYRDGTGNNVPIPLTAFLTFNVTYGLA